MSKIPPIEEIAKMIKNKTELDYEVKKYILNHIDLDFGHYFEIHLNEHEKLGPDQRVQLGFFKKFSSDHTPNIFFGYTPEGIFLLEGTLNNYQSFDLIQTVYDDQIYYPSYQSKGTNLNKFQWKRTDFHKNTDSGLVKHGLSKSEQFNNKIGNIQIYRGISKAAVRGLVDKYFLMEE